MVAGPGPELDQSWVGAGLDITITSFYISAG